MLALTAEEKILVYLGSFERYIDEVDAPFETTQKGLSSNLELKRSHVSIALKGLKNKGLVTERLSHVKKSARRRKVYFLTRKGLESSNKLRRLLEDEEVVFRDGTKEENLKVKEVVSRLPGNVDTIRVCIHVKNEIFDLSTFGIPSEDKSVDFSDAIPELKYFFGRDQELRMLREFYRSKTKRIFALKGLAGIGKTTLLAKFASDPSIKRVFMYRISEWTTLRNVLGRLADFLKSNGKRSLSSNLKPKDVPDIEDVVELISKDLANMDALLIFDDVHDAGTSLVMLLKAFIANIERAKGTKLIISGRTIPSLYSRKEVKVKGIVEEVRLKGLDRDSSLEVLRTQSEGSEQNFLKIYRLTKGHPLFLELMALNGALGKQTDVRTYVNEEIYSKLSKSEKGILERASVFRYPVKSEFLLVGDDADQGVLDDLVEKSLLHRSGDVLEMHEIPKEFFYNRMSPKRRGNHHRAAAEFYEDEDGTLALIESIFHLVKASRMEIASERIADCGLDMISKGYHDEMLELIEMVEKEKVRASLAVRLLFLKAEIITMGGDWKGAMDCLKDALTKSKNVGFKEGLTQALYELGVMHYRKGEWEKALERYGRALELSEKEGFEERQAKLYNTIGIVHWRKKRLELAEDFYKKSIELYRKLKNKRGVAGGYNNIGIVHWELKDMDKALEFYEKSMKISKRLDDKRTIAILYNNMGEVHRVNGDKREAMRCFEDSLALSEALEFKWQIAEIHRNIGRLSRGAKRKEHLETALKLFTRLGAKKDIEEVSKMLKK
jgi:tetratricopeptide (TPR) repeat protein/DNA-binding MarR family transcriptional regulator